MSSQPTSPDEGTTPDASTGEVTSPSSETPTLRQAGAQLGDFRLLRRLGKGGMAEVWLAEQMSLKRNVAVKLLRPELMEDTTHVQRFQTEAKAAAGLNHANIVQVYMVGVDGQQHYIAQEYVQGQTLKAFLQKKGPLDLLPALHILRQVASALQVAAERGIVHRDIKPENIMLTRKGEAKVADFGLAQLQGGERLNLTQEGVTMGTPLYMSPEQVTGQPLDQRSDIYSLGITTYQMLTGRPPFTGDNAVSVAVQHLHETAPSLTGLRPDLPAAVCDMVHRMIAKSPDDRYPDSATLLADVRRLIKALKTGSGLEDVRIGTLRANSPFPTKRPYLVLSLLCVVVMATTAAAGWWLRPGVPPFDPSASVTAVAEKSSAREQYLHAMFLGDDEAAFQAVKVRFPSDRLWVHRAEEQLTLLYLKDPQRHREASRQISALESLRTVDERFYVEARLARAYLDAFHGRTETSRRILEASRADFDQHLTGSWIALREDVLQMLGRDESGT